MGLVGMFFTADAEDLSYYNVGEVVSEVPPSHYLVRIEGSDNRARPLELVEISEMTSAIEGMKRWRFFETKAKRQAWVDWLNSPSPPRVIKLVRR